MRALFTIAGLLVVVAVVGVIAKKQLGSVAPAPTPVAPTAGGAPGPAGTPKQQLDQVKRSLDAAAQPRAMPDESK